MQRCDLGLIGWGTVGGGVSRLLADDADLLRRRCGLDLRLATIVTRTPGRARQAPTAGARVTDQLDALLGDQSIATVIHLVGGTTDATEICIACLRAGKNVVTANKAMLALHGDELFRLAASRGLCIAFEAAVAGGIPVIAALRDGLVANRIHAISGIVNGTCNYILSRMDADGSSFADALREAQRLGYAEADPATDIDGIDSAHKLALLARIAFHSRVPFESVRIEGIRSITSADIASARTMGCRIKLLAVAANRPEGVELRVAPTLVPMEHPLASVSGSHNGVYVESSAAGTTLLVGPGAGALPTASAILADVVDVCTGRYQATASRFSFFTEPSELCFLPEAEEFTGSYARFVAPDRAGVLAGIATILSRHGVSLLSLHQAARHEGPATIEAITHPHRGGSFLRAISEIDGGGLTVCPTVVLRRL